MNGDSEASWRILGLVYKPLNIGLFCPLHNSINRDARSKWRAKEGHQAKHFAESRKIAFSAKDPVYSSFRKAYSLVSRGEFPRRFNFLDGKPK